MGDDEDDDRDLEFVALRRRQQEIEGRLQSLHLTVAASIEDINDALDILTKTLRELQAAHRLHGPKR